MTLTVSSASQLRAVAIRGIGSSTSGRHTIGRHGIQIRVQREVFATPPYLDGDDGRLVCQSESNDPPKKVIM
jgi:hypothetical protein